MHLTPYSRYPSYGMALDHRRTDVIRTVETVGRFRRSYAFNPSMGVSTSKVAFEEYKFTTDWKTPFEVHLKVVAQEIDDTDSCIRNIRTIDEQWTHKEPKEFAAKVHQLVLEWDGLKDTMDKHRRSLAEAKDADQYLSHILVYESDTWSTNDQTPRRSSRDQEDKHLGVMRRLSFKIKEIAEKADQLLKERNLIRAQQEHASTIPDASTVSSETDLHVPDVHDHSTMNGSIPNGTLGLKASGLYELHGDIDDLLQWISDREAMTERQDLGQNYEHVLDLQNRFQQFVQETESEGSRRVERANQECDDVIASEHEDAPMVALWKDNLNEAWENLLELMHTWTLLLEANLKLQKFFHDCLGTYSHIKDLMHRMPDELGRQFSSLTELQRQHQIVVGDLKTLESRVKQIQHDGEEVSASYAGDKALEIQIRQTEVAKAWRQLQMIFDYKQFSFACAKDLFEFMQMSNGLSQWMEISKKRMVPGEWPRDISNMESVADTLESLKTEIDQKEEDFVSCIALGRELLNEQHYASWEVEKKLIRLTTERADLMRYWGNRWEHLQLVLQVYDLALETGVPDVPARSVDIHVLHYNGVSPVSSRPESQMENTELFQTLQRLSLTDLKELHKRQLEELKARELNKLTKRGSQEKVETTFNADPNLSRVETTLKSDGIPTRDGFEGLLVRKHTWISMDHRADSRGWEKLYAVLRGNHLYLYIDYRHREHEVPLKGDRPIDLSKCIVDLALDYKKRKNVFFIRLDDGAEYLFQARDEEDLYNWLQHLQATSNKQHAPADMARFQQRSRSSSSNRRRGFFSFKK